MSAPKDVTTILKAVGRGDCSARDQLMPVIYDELLALARAVFQRQPANHTLQATALVHEAFLRLVGRDDIEWTGRAHFLAVAAKAMRQILISHARAKHSEKRGGQAQRITLSEMADSDSPWDVDLMALDRALTELHELDERAARVVELRFFGGLNIDETAHILQVSSRTVVLSWRMARAWLLRQLHDADVRA